ncbi:hypothetical protein DFH09DRAFT_1368566 [Mycena vulgaris]|nr:hypothetical protein DFH09DRAFT_1368566 [Mycena vulgaris]
MAMPVLIDMTGTMVVYVAKTAPPTYFPDAVAATPARRLATAVRGPPLGHLVPVGNDRSSRSPRRRRTPTRSPERRSSSSVRPSEDDPDFDYQAAYNILRANLEREKKRKRDEPSTSVQGLGRGIRKLAALFGEIPHIMAEAQAYEREPFDEDHGIDEYAEDVTEEELQYLDQKRRQVTFSIERLIPNLTRKIGKMEPTETSDYFTLIQKGANDARSDDLRRVTRFLANCLNEDRDKPELAVFDHSPLIEVTNEEGESMMVKGKAPFLHPSDRSTRGIQHDLTGAMISTTDVDWDDASTREKLRSGAIDLGGNYFVRVFYERFSGDPNKVEVGFLKSRYLVRSYKAVFTAPASAEKDDGDENTRPSKKAKATATPRKAVCEILGMNGKVTPRSIAYVAILVYFAFTNAGNWTTEYYGVSFPQMYDFIVDFFEAPKAGTGARKRADDLLTWWNKKIFPTHASSAATHQTSIASRSKLREQRAAMEMAAVAAIVPVVTAS